MTAISLSTAQHVVVPASGPDGAAPLDVVTIARTASAALQPAPDGALPGPEELARSIGLLTEQIGLLLPIAQAAHRRNRPAGASGPGLVGHGLAYVRRRMTHTPPDPFVSPAEADTWARESARCVQQLLGLALDGHGPRHAAAAR
ncbi:DUF6415 family natural product biosynthesis protein [Streptomyces sp. VNUA116]|uniref:DUF6415 family natural product biosynthesis protein n=1 Tax=Streptomyces sp. VNUA116 TaxID=3062449 RepID=UPI002675E98A|nr:DUF6415 family natural product biosynthesis protein [Streptomyces sp. VNUA116]WKU42632.1 DUF6415 family natural product biosynthesis protein [Streptomyces sp. VNUA116]